jgi:hypothetical protein
MVEDLATAYEEWVVPVREYANPHALVQDVEKYVTGPADAKLAE